VRVRLIVNPVASSMSDRRQAAIVAGLGGRHTLETVETRARGHARDLAAEAAAAGVDVVVVASGDGTLNEAADGLVHSPTALAPLPGGATNVFARAVGYGNRLDDATELLLAALDAESIRRIGVGAANGRHFLFHLGAGFDAAVVDRIERNPKVKRYAAHPAFALQTVRLLARGYDRRVPAMHVETPEAHAPHDSFFTVVSNVAPYTYVGPRRMLLTPAASLDRALAVTSLTRFRLVDAVGAIGSSVGRSARLQHAEEIVQLSDVNEVRLTAPEPGRPFPWQVDGEPLGTVDLLDVRYVPDALSVVLPA
jgi:diacylglycerol kinase family enzyme